MGETKEVQILNDMVKGKPGSFSGNHGWWQKRTIPFYVLENGVWSRKTRATEFAAQKVHMSAYRVKPPSLIEQKARQASLETLRSRETSEMIKRMTEDQLNHEFRMQQRHESELREAEGDQARQLQTERERHDYATAEIVALQEAYAERVQERERQRVKADLKRKQAEEHLQSMLQRFENEKQYKTTDFSRYLSALSALANAYSEQGNKQKARELRNEAIDLPFC
jgi:hypothetical protein